MSLTAGQRRKLDRYSGNGGPHMVALVANALAELDRLQATVARRGELLRRAERDMASIALWPKLRAAITAELAEGEDGG